MHFNKAYEILMGIVSGPCFEKHLSGNIHIFLEHQLLVVSGRDQVSLFLCVQVHPLLISAKVRDLDAEVRKYVQVVEKSSNQSDCKLWQKF